MTKSGDAPTRSDALYRKLRADVLGGRLAPGQRLKFAELARRYDTSVGTAREALTRLVTEGLVRTQSHQGYMVTPLSCAHLAELAQARAEIESLVLRLSVREGDMRWEAQLVGAHHLLERTTYIGSEDPDRPTDDWAAVHAAFHQALLAGCRNQRLLDAATTLRHEAELYRQWSVSIGREPNRDLPGEHRALLEAAVDRRVEPAAELLRDHIAHTAQVLLDGAGEEPLAPGPAGGTGRSRRPL
jgi:DNA-binding GntR family transcriptional regulator